MSDSVSTGGGDAVSVDTSTDNASDNFDSQDQTGQESGHTSTNGGQTQGQGRDASGKFASQKPGAQKTQEPATQEELEEIALGAIKGKVPKALAKAIKDFERGARTKLSEAAQERKLLQLAKTDPDKFFEVTGIDADTFAEQRLARKYELMQMSPEQKRAMELEQELEQYKQQELQSKSGVINDIKSLLGADAPENLEQYAKEDLQAYLQQQQEVVQREQSGLEKEVIEAWKESGLPKHRRFGAMMSYEMLSHQKRTGEPLQASEAAARVKSAWSNDAKEILAQMAPQAIHELLGKDTIQKLRDYDIERVTAKAAPQMNQNKRPGSNPASQESRKPMNEYEWREHIRKMKV
jgi:hypothetical protein